jgi:tetratricopeptide (TPR) repeat protein
MGVVYKARHLALKRIVAIKMLAFGHPSAAERARFRAEAEAVARLQHPNIVQIHEVGDADGQPFIALEYVAGGSLAERLAGKPLPPRDAARLIATLAEAMHLAHSRNLVHRDLKPGNVLLAGDADTPSGLWHPKVTDFGLVRQLDADSGQTFEGVVIGTPRYMAPEQAEGRAHSAGPAADVYALGAILYECLTGQAPFGGVTPLETLEQVRSREPAAPSSHNRRVPRDLETICLKCLRKEPERRYPSAHELADDLGRFERGEPVAARPVAWPARLWRWGLRNPTMAGLLTALLALFLLTAGGGLWLQRRQSERRNEAARRDAELRSEVNTAVTQAVSFRKRFHFREAQELLDQARQHLGPTGPEDLRRQVEEAQSDLKLAQTLDKVRMRLASPVAGNYRLGTESLYTETFANAGLGRPVDDSDAVAAKIRRMALRQEIVGALDDWASITQDEERRRWLLAVARGADRDQLRDRLRQPELWADATALAKVVRDLPVHELSPQLATALARLLRKAGGSVPLLSAAQAQSPQDFWLNYELGFALFMEQKWAEALSYYRAALALRPEDAEVYTNLGLVLFKMGRLDQAISHYRQALRFDSQLAPAHARLGLALHDEGRPNEAMAHYQEAIRLDPEASAEAHCNFGNALLVLGRLDEAISHFRESMRLDPVALPIGHCNIGVILLRKGRLGEAAAECRRAVELDPEGSLAHVYLAAALLQSGQFAEAQKAVHYSLNVLPTNEAQRPALQDKLKLCERLLALEARLPALLQGKERPAEPELLELARLYRDFGRPHAAKDLYALAFAARPALADDLDAAARYNAACCAARASTDDGLERAGLSELERATLRRQALTWLRADLALRTKLFEGGNSVDWTLAFWQQDTALGSVRDPAALARLTADEREHWQRLWSDVAALRAADPLWQGRTRAARRQWSAATDAYARALKISATDTGDVWFEYAALLLLSGDHQGYARSCAHMIEACGKNGGPRTYHVARACTLAPDDVTDGALPGRLAEKELQAYARDFWSLTERGALAYRTGRFRDAVAFSEQSLRADLKLGRAVLNWLWLALAQQRLGRPEEARRWLNEATTSLNQYPDGMPDRAEDELGLDVHNWLEAHVLRREAEALIGSTEKH